jgi:hypothetical protein
MLFLVKNNFFVCCSGHHKCAFGFSVGSTQDMDEHEQGWIVAESIWVDTSKVQILLPERSCSYLSFSFPFLTHVKLQGPEAYLFLDCIGVWYSILLNN